MVARMSVSAFLRPLYRQLSPIPTCLIQKGLPLYTSAIRAREPGKFEVYQVPSKYVMRKCIMAFNERLVGSVGKMDDELIWAAGPDGAGVYIGELDGEWISSVCVLQHSDTYVWGGLYYCKVEHRGKGFAFEMYKTARAAVDSNINIGLDAEVSKVCLYEREGFKTAWEVNYCYFPVSSILEAYHSVAVDGISIKLATDVDFAQLRLYTEDVIGITFAQAGLLEKLITLPTHTAIVAVNDSGSIVGFAVIRECVNCEEKGYRLAPVLADTADIARLLMLELAKTVDVRQKFIVGVLHDINPEAQKIADEVKGEKYVTYVRMYSRGEPPFKKEKYFGEFSAELVG